MFRVLVNSKIQGRIMMLIRYYLILVTGKGKLLPLQ